MFGLVFVGNSTLHANALHHFVGGDDHDDHDDDDEGTGTGTGSRCDGCGRGRLVSPPACDGVFYCTVPLTGFALSSTTWG